MRRLRMPMPHLLVIDDDVKIRRVLARTLGQLFVVEGSVDAEAARARIDGGALFDVILCDLNLPGMSGHDLYDPLKSRAHDLSARLVIITGEVPTANDAFAAMLGRRYLLKPWSMTDLASTLNEVAFPRV